MDRISIIVPVYNCGAFLPRCVDSLRKQTYPELEILLVDDGSTDGTAALCDSLAAADSRIVVLHRANGGVSAARNAGLSASRGAYIAFADADDYVEPDHILHLYQALQNHHSDVSVCSYLTEKEDKCTLPSEGDGDSVRSSYREVCYDHDSAVCELLAGGAVGGYVWNKLYRRELLEGCGFESGVKILEDLLFNYEVFGKVKTAVFIDTKSYHYIQRGQSAMHCRFGEEHKAMVETARRIADRTASCGGEVAAAGRGLLATTILWVVDVMAEHGPYDAALMREYRAAFRPLRAGYLRLKRVPLSYRASAIFFSMGYGVYRVSVKLARKIMG